MQKVGVLCQKNIANAKAFETVERVKVEGKISAAPLFIYARKYTISWNIIVNRVERIKIYKKGTFSC